VSYKGFTCNLTAGDVELMRLLLLRYRAGDTPLKVDLMLIEMYLIRFEEFLEVSPDGSTAEAACADG